MLFKRKEYCWKFLYAISREYLIQDNIVEALKYNLANIEKIVANNSILGLGNAYLIQASIYEKQDDFLNTQIAYNRAYILFDIEGNQYLKNIASMSLKS